MEYVDLTHLLNSDLPVYGADLRPQLKQIAEITKSGFIDHQLCTGMHVGTHIDAPRHMLKDGKLLSDFGPRRFVAPAHLIDARDKQILDGELLAGLDIKPGDFIVVMTGWYKHFGQSEYFEKFPVVAESFVQILTEAKVGALGLDTPSPDRSPYKIHKLLLAKDILIVENLTNLEPLLGLRNLEIYALPLKLPTEAAPARVIARGQL